jgi:hypothetical protein
MKNTLIVIAALFTGFSIATAAEKPIKTPNGGRLIQGITPHAEFLISAAKKIEIRFLLGDQVIAPAAQMATVTMGDRANPTKLTFTKQGDKLISDQAIPAGNNLPLVLQIKVSPDGKPVTEKFNLNLDTCPTCSFAEYACICDHAH